MKLLRLPAFVVLVSVLALAQQPPAAPANEPPPDRGFTSGNTYTSTYFGFHYDFPAGWEVDRELAQRTVDSPSGMPARSHYLLFHAVRPAAAMLPTDTTPAEVQVSAEFRKIDDARRPPEQYLRDYVPVITGAQAFAPRVVRIGGRDFLRQDFRMPMQGGSDGAIYTTVLLTPARDYVLGWIFTASSAPGIDALVSTLDTLRFH